MLGSGVAGSWVACSRKNRYVQGGMMEIGIGLPATIPGTRGSLVLDWAGRADSGPFSSLGIIDRLVYTNYEPLVTLAAAVTERVRLMSTVLIAPLRGAGVLAKQAPSVDALSGVGSLWGSASGPGKTTSRRLPPPSMTGLAGSRSSSTS
jgi:alkanesulfonate monooxygenase SsuD/methylene tetrahydromethanopterin reductase-like flavin-dependent oxidoreductase (luciferase family)